MKIAICEENEKELSILEKNIKKIFKKYDFNINENIKIVKFNYGKDLLNSCIYNGNYFDIILINISSRNEKDIKISEELIGDNKVNKVILISNAENYFKQGHSIRSCAYLIKPYEIETLEKVLLFVIEQVREENKEILYINSNYCTFGIKYSDIIYFESVVRKIKLYTKHGKEYEFYDKLNNINEKMQHKNFIKIHRSYLVNMKYIKIIENNNVITSENNIIPISKKNLSTVKNSFINYVRGNNLNSTV